MSLKDNVVRCVLFSPKWTLRLNYLHHFLATNLSPYAAECSAFYPPQELLQVSCPPLPPPRAALVLPVPLFNHFCNKPLTVCC